MISRFEYRKYVQTLVMSSKGICAFDTAHLHENLHPVDVGSRVYAVYSAISTRIDFPVKASDIKFIECPIMIDGIEGIEQLVTSRFRRVFETFNV